MLLDRIMVISKATEITRLLHQSRLWKLKTDTVLAMSPFFWFSATPFEPALGKVHAGE